MTRWKCSKCPYIYDPRIGDPDGGIPPGTPFERIPDDWRCPVCGAGKHDFHVLAPERSGAPAPAPQATKPARPGPAAAPAAHRTEPPPEPPSAPPPPQAGWTVGILRGKPQGLA